MYHSFKYKYISLEGLYKALVKKDLVKTTLFKSNQRLKFYIILSILHMLIFIIYQSIHSFHSKSKPVPTRFHKPFSYKSEDNNLSSVACDLYFDLQCVYVASTHSILIYNATVFWRLIKSIGAIKYVK